MNVRTVESDKEMLRIKTESNNKAGVVFYQGFYFFSVVVFMLLSSIV